MVEDHGTRTSVHKEEKSEIKECLPEPWARSSCLAEFSSRARSCAVARKRSPVGTEARCRRTIRATELVGVYLRGEDIVSADNGM